MTRGRFLTGVAALAVAPFLPGRLRAPSSPRPSYFLHFGYQDGEALGLIPLWREIAEQNAARHFGFPIPPENVRVLWVARGELRWA